jgi:hypothetical protein
VQRYAIPTLCRSFGAVCALLLGACFHEDPETKYILDGAWTSGCIFEESVFLELTLSFDDGEFTHQAIAYADSSCLQESATLIDVSGTYALGGTTTTSRGVDVRKVDFYIAAATGTMHAPNIFAYLNNDLYLGTIDIYAEDYPTALNLNYPFFPDR